MKTYYLEHHSTKKRYEIVAQNKTELRKLAYGKIPDGRYVIYNKKGEVADSVTISKRTKTMAEKKHNLPKAEYDNLYFYVTEGGQDWIRKGEYTPTQMSSPRRYESIQEVRKAALAKSYANYRIIKDGYPFRDKSVIFYIYKGSKLLGEVFCSPLEKAPYKGTGVWIGYGYYNVGPVKSGSTSYRLMKDGSIKRK